MISKLLRKIFVQTPSQARHLTAQELTIYRPYFTQQILASAQIIEGKVPFWLRSDMQGVVLGHRIFFRQHAYQANTAEGVELLGHELVHVAQFATGLTVAKYLWSSRQGYRKNPYELIAYTMAATIKAVYLLENVAN